MPPLNIALPIRAYACAIPSAPADYPADRGPWVPTEIVFMPVGTHEIAADGGDDGEGFQGSVIVDQEACADLQASFAELTAEGWKFWIDANHDNGAAMGWLEGLHWDPTRGVIAAIAWTPDGRRAIESKAFVSFSPTFLINKVTRRPWTLIPSEAAGALVNAPAFRRMPDILRCSAKSPSLAAKVAASSNQKTNTNMSQPATAAPAATNPPAATPVRASDETPLADRVAKIEETLGTVVASMDKVTATVEKLYEKANAHANAPAPVATPVVPPAVVEPRAPVTSEPGILESVRAYAKARAEGRAIDAGRIYASSIHRKLGERGMSTLEFGRVLAANSLGTLAGTLVVQRALALLKLRLPILQGVTTDFSSENAQFNQTIVTRTRGIPSVAVFDNANGYVAQNASTTDVSVTISRNIGVPISFSVNELASTNRDLFGEQTEGMIYAIAKDMSDSLYALITNANFSNSTQKATASLARADINAMAAALYDRGVPDFERHLLLNTAAFERIMSDSAIVSLAAFQRPALIEEFALPNIGGFKVHAAPGLPGNGENLTGFGFSPDALVIATRLPNDYTSVLGGGANNGTVTAITDPDSGISMQLAQWVNHDLARTTTRVAVMYGVAKGQGASGQRLRSA